MSSVVHDFIRLSEYHTLLLCTTLALLSRLFNRTKTTTANTSNGHLNLSRRLIRQRPSIILSNRLNRSNLGTNLFKPLRNRNRTRTNQRTRRLLPNINLISIVANTINRNLLSRITTIKNHVSHGISNPTTRTTFRSNLRNYRIIIINNRTRIISRRSRLRQIHHRLIRRIKSLVRLILLSFRRARTIKHRLVNSNLSHTQFTNTHIAMGRSIIDQRPNRRNFNINSSLFPLTLMAKRFKRTLKIQMLSQRRAPILRHRSVIFNGRTMALFPNLLRPLNMDHYRISILHLPPKRRNRFQPLNLFKVDHLRRLVRHRTTGLLRGTRFAIRYLLRRQHSTTHHDLPRASHLNLRRHVNGVLTRVNNLLGRDHLGNHRNITRQTRTTNTHFRPINRIRWFNRRQIFRRNTRSRGPIRPNIPFAGFRDLFPLAFGRYAGVVPLLRARYGPIFGCLRLSNSSLCGALFSV